jgi:hypothetical protein
LVVAFRGVEGGTETKLQGIRNCPARGLNWILVWKSPVLTFTPA